MLSSLRRWWTIPERVDHPELLDSGDCSLAEVRQTFAELDDINRWLGGHAALRRWLLPRLREAARQQRPVRLLDVGCGGAGVSIEVVKWARREGIALKVVALDLTRRHLDIARENSRDYPEISLLLGDARQLPFTEAEFDFVISTLFLHHLAPRDLAEVLRSLASVCRRTLVLTDLVRGRLPLLFFRTAAPLFAKSRITVHDGLISIARAYRPSEIRGILQQAGLARSQIHEHGLYYRMTIVADI